MRFRHILTVLVLGLSMTANAQQEEEHKYMRSSLCIMMVEHPQLEFNDEIEAVFKKMPIPNRFNDHDLGVRVFRFANDDNQLQNIKIFSDERQIAKKMVSKWFGRNKNTGSFNTDLIKSRGYYNATQIDINMAKNTVRGRAMLEDFGEHLIGHTYWVVNDIKYINQSNFTTNFKNGLVALGGAADMVNETIKGKEKAAQDTVKLGKTFNNMLGVMDDVKGFRVKITSYLFRLDWNDEVQQSFYENYYTETPEDEKEQKKVAAFQNDNQLFKMQYIGEVTSSSTKTTISARRTKEDMIMKVCTRALDKNIAELQHKYPEFRIKAELISVSPLRAYIGMKEDVTAKRRYEVLEENVDEETGRHSYKRVGIIEPVPGNIWDNRYLANEEGTRESRLRATEFKKISGGEFYPGMLIREMK